MGEAPAIVRKKKGQITLPEGMSYDDAIDWLERKQIEEDTKIGVMHRIECFPLDGLVAFHRALADKYGWTGLVPTPGFFGSNPPIMIGVPISPTESMNVPWGCIEIPNVAGHLDTVMDTDGDDPAFIIGGQTTKKHEDEILEIAQLTRKFVRDASIYRGKAIKIDLAWTREGEDFHPERHAPRFMDLGTSPPTLIFSRAVESSLQIGLFGPIEHASACREAGVPLKRGILLYGRYGTGKTLTASVTASRAVGSGFTFIYLSSVLDLKRGLDLAQRYAPAVLFAEDIDRVVTGPRSSELDEILNTLDGIDTKNGEVITVFTTNHIDNINKAALRAGRLDALVEITPPDAEAATRLVEHYANGLLAEGVNLPSIGEVLAGRIPSTIREVVERSKIAAIVRLSGGNIRGRVTEDDLLQAAQAMKTHEDLLVEKSEKVHETQIKLVEVGRNGAVGTHLTVSR